MEKVDAVIIGAGQGGDPLARSLATQGRKTVLIEQKFVGGTCVNFGCTPTKTLYNSARVAYLARRGKDFGIRTSTVEVDMAKVHRRVQNVVESFRHGTKHKLESIPNLSLIHGHAKFTGSDTVKVGDHVFQAPIIVLNTGARPRIPDINGLAEMPYLTNETLLALTDMPRHLVILGGGYISLEFAQIYCRLGTKVTVIEQNSRLLPREDQDVSDAVIEVLEGDGIEILLDTEVDHVGGRGNVHLKNGREIRASHLLVATGRTPNTDQICVEKSGIKLDDRGYIKVDNKLATNVKGIYAIGDVKGGPAFTHISYDDYRVLESNLCAGGDRTTDDRQEPYVMFLDPQLGRCGPSDAELKKKGIKFKSVRLDATGMARAIEMGETRGFIKAAVSPEGQLLSATTFCVEGGELLATLQVAMRAKLPVEELRNAVISHPTLAESLNNLFMQLT